MEMLLLITIMLLVIITLILIIRLTRQSVDLFLKTIHDQINNKNTILTDCFSKDVLEIYLDILNNPNGWVLEQHILRRISDNMAIWAANDIHARNFFSHPAANNSEEIEEKNSKLTYYDKVLLDKIVNSYKTRQDKLVTKFFMLDTPK